MVQQQRVHPPQQLTHDLLPQQVGVRARGTPLPLPLPLMHPPFCAAHSLRRSPILLGPTPSSARGSPTQVRQRTRCALQP